MPSKIHNDLWPFITPCRLPKKTAEHFFINDAPTLVPPVRIYSLSLVLQVAVYDEHWPFIEYEMWTCMYYAHLHVNVCTRFLARFLQIYLQLMCLFFFESMFTSSLVYMLKPATLQAKRHMLKRRLWDTQTKRQSFLLMLFSHRYNFRIAILEVSGKMDACTIYIEIHKHSY